MKLQSSLKNNKMPPQDRFLARVYKCDKTGCWLWTGTNSHGYGIFNVNGVRTRAHRYSYTTYIGAIPVGHFICHSCDVRNCVNPKHLFLGLPKSNSDDMVAKNRQSRGSNRPCSKLTEDDVAYMRAIYIPKHPEFGAVNLAAKFSIHYYTAMNILLGKTWKHVT